MTDVLSGRKTMCSPGMNLLRYTVVFLVATSLAQTTIAQQQRSSSELLKHYVQARTVFLATKDGNHASFQLTYRQPETLYLPGDTVRSWLEGLEHKRLMDALPEPIPLFTVSSWEKISTVRAQAYDKDFRSTQWAFTGSSSRSPIDTMRTAEVRSRFESAFGAPTLTLAELPDTEGLEREEIIQFEYWFLLNDSIRVAVLDVNGPWDRGVVLAADQRVRNHLPIIKQDFLERMVTEAQRAPFTDYYYNWDRRSWYLTGFDGASFFDRRIEAPDMTAGRPGPFQTIEPVLLPAANEPN